MENQLGNSIVKAVWILSVALVICALIYIAKVPNYTPLGSDWYIHQQTGKIYYAPQEFQNQNKK